MMFVRGAPHEEVERGLHAKGARLHSANHFRRHTIFALLGIFIMLCFLPARVAACVTVTASSRFMGLQPRRKFVSVFLLVALLACPGLSTTRAVALVALLCAIWFLGMALEPRRKFVRAFRLLALAAYAVRP